MKRKEYEEFTKEQTEQNQKLDGYYYDVVSDLIKNNDIKSEDGNPMDEYFNNLKKSVKKKERIIIGSKTNRFVIRATNR